MAQPARTHWTSRRPVRLRTSFLFRGRRLGFGLVVQLGGRDCIGPLQPASEVNIGTTPGAERSKPRDLRFLSERAATDRTNAGFLHTVPTPGSAESFDLEALAALIAMSFQLQPCHAATGKGAADFVL